MATKKKKRQTDTKYKYIAVCQDCTWMKKDKGAQGHAALHTDQTEHTTKVTVSGIIIYSPLKRKSKNKT